MILIVLVISGDKLVRAIELVKLLSLEKSVKGAIKLVTALKLPNLAERFNSVLEVSFRCPKRVVQLFTSQSNWTQSVFIFTLSYASIFNRKDCLMKLKR